VANFRNVNANQAMKSRASRNGRSAISAFQSGMTKIDRVSRTVVTRSFADAAADAAAEGAADSTSGWS